MYNVFKFFRDHPNSKHTSLAFLSSANLPKDVFRGSMKQYLEQHKKLNEADAANKIHHDNFSDFNPTLKHDLPDSLKDYHQQQKNKFNAISTIELCGEKLGEGVYDSSGKVDADQLNDFMAIINDNKIQKLSFAGCTLNPTAGIILGLALKTNSNLKELYVCSSELQQMGMFALLRNLKHNNSLKTLYCRSYNVMTYSWSYSEIKALNELISSNKVLEKIILPNNKIEEREHIGILAEPYKTDEKRPLASITGFEIGITSIPEFNKENALNGSLEDAGRTFGSTIRFS